MSIVCGIDFSEASARAAEVAAELAARLKLPLHLVHALAEWHGEDRSDGTTSLVMAAHRALAAQATKLGVKGIEVHLQVELDSPGQSLIRVAEKVAATFLLFGATGRGWASGRPVGSTADLLAQQSHIPALAVRDGAPFQAWLRGHRPLRVLVGLDFSVVSDGAWRWAKDLVRVGPVEFIGAYVYWPPHEFHRLGIGGVRSCVDPDPHVEAILGRELESRFLAEPGVTTRFRMQPSLGRPADHLLSIATEERADLIVVGSHQRSAVTRLWEGSVSRGVLHYATTSVACVPLLTVARVAATPAVRTALAATDFSAVGNAAIAHAYGQVGRGGKVYLVNVIEPAGERSALEPQDIFQVSEASEQTKMAVTEQLRLLVAPRHGSGSEDQGTQIVVLQAADAADAIAQAADRLAVDVICLGTHGRSGVVKAALGSVAQAVIGKTQRPVLLVKAPKV